MVCDQNKPGRSVADIDWPGWDSTMDATLLFLVHRGEVLLIHKKRGLGKGKVNGPGGRIERGESPEEAAVREVEEEVGLTPIDPAHLGILKFDFTDGLRLLVHVFRATMWEGTLVETDEALPFWVALDRIPYDSMWEDDRYWIPLMLDGRTFEGRFIFSGDEMLDYTLQVGKRRGSVE